MLALVVVIAVLPYFINFFIKNVSDFANLILINDQKLSQIVIK